MIVITDGGVRQKEVLESLNLPEGVEVIEDIYADLGDADRVLYIASLDTGGTRAQLDVLRGNPGVGEWYVLSVDTQEEAWNYFQERLMDVNAPIRVYSAIEPLLQDLQRPPLRRKACLLICRDERTYTLQELDEMTGMLKCHLPGWTFETAYLQQSPDAVSQTSCSRVVLLGRRPENFAGMRLTDNVPVLVALTHQEEYVWECLRPRTLRRNVFTKIRGMDWGSEMQSDSFFILSALYEDMRMKVAGDPALLVSLDRDQRFEMWDPYGLPERRSAYTPERIREFLSQFDGIERMAKRMAGV